MQNKARTHLVQLINSLLSNNNNINKFNSNNKITELMDSLNHLNKMIIQIGNLIYNHKWTDNLVHMAMELKKERRNHLIMEQFQDLLTC